MTLRDGTTKTELSFFSHLLNFASTHFHISKVPFINPFYLIKNQIMKKKKIEIEKINHRNLFFPFLVVYDIFLSGREQPNLEFKLFGFPSSRSFALSSERLKKLQIRFIQLSRTEFNTFFSLSFLIST